MEIVEFENDHGGAARLVFKDGHKVYLSEEHADDVRHGNFDIEEYDTDHGSMYRVIFNDGHRVVMNYDHIEEFKKTSKRLCAACKKRDEGSSAWSPESTPLREIGSEEGESYD